MKTRFIYPLVFLLISSLSFAQDYKERREKVKALKVAFITEKLELTTEEAQKFWPIYNAFDEKQAELRHEKMRGILDRFKPGNVENLSEKEASALLIQMEKIEELTLYILELHQEIKALKAEHVLIRSQLRH